MKAYYLAFYDNNLQFSIYDISNFNRLEDKENTIVFMESIHLRGHFPFYYDYEGCNGLYFNNDRFYSLCWDTQKNVYVAGVVAKNLRDIQHSQKVVLSSWQSGALHTRMQSVNSFDLMFYRYILYIDRSQTERFCFTDFIKNKPLKVEENYCVKDIMLLIKRSMGLADTADNPVLSIGDMLFQDRFLYITDTNHGIFVIELEDMNGDVKAVSCYLYALTSGPNDIHLERVNEDTYQLAVSTTLQNEVIVFEEIAYNTTLPTSSILRLNRIHAFCIPRYYSFGMKSAINNNFLVNELYNSKDKDVAIRISSRESNTINDSTLSIQNMRLSISSMIYMGFIESYTNVLFIVTSKAITIYTIERPKIQFIAPPVGQIPNLRELGYQHTKY